ncbi:MAG: fumarylacetoacetate hydrolase family protein [Rhodospirillaceae bacterium]|nr:fumarylacetoacetate hydrolase family protein [Rhodospirillaceae bacterium]
MKLVRHGPVGRERPGMLDGEGGVRDLGGVVDDISGTVLSAVGLDRLRAIDPATLPPVPVGTRLGPCVGGVGKVVCVGLNYADHAAEAGMDVPAEPVLFMKAITAVCGPDDDLLIPPGSQKTDWEVELGIVIGATAKHVARADALRHVAGFCVVNDVSERAYQSESTGQWVKGKSYDSFGSLGPWLVTRDEVADPQALALWTEVNGHRFQNGSTRTMVFGVLDLVSYISRFMRLEPGDVIATGTPPGVGLGQRPQVFLKPGDEVVMEVAGLGRQHRRCVADT